jgi:serine/threonine protein kinase
LADLEYLRLTPMSNLDTDEQVELCPSCGQHYPVNTGFCARDGAELLRQVPDPMIGSALPRHYRIVERLGRGAMSVVYRGIYEPLNKPVAVKLLKSHLVSDILTFKRFQQEAKTAGALEHPHIVGVFDFGTTEQGVPYLIMELVEGQALHQMIRRGRIPMDVALRVFIQTADALNYTHQRGVIHRDVKPSNILVTDDGGLASVKLVDFGIAKLQHYEGNPSLNLTQAGEVFGTPLYVSPEQAMGRELDARADLYSLGCVMYEVIAGRPPFQGPSAFDVLRMQIQAQPMPLQVMRPPDELPPALVAAVKRAMEKNPADRQDSMEELVFELQRAEIELARGNTIAPGNPAPGRQFTPTVAMTVMPVMPLESPPPRTQSISQSRLQAAVDPVIDAGKRRPIIPFALSSVAGCMAGIGILMFMHQSPEGTKPPTAAPPKQGVEQSQMHSPVAADILDAQTAEMREQALQRYDEKDYVGAQKGLQKAIDAARANNESTGQGLLLADQCMVFLEMRKYPEAFFAGEAAVYLLDGKPSVPKKDLSFALRGLGTACYYRDEFAEAETYLKRSTDLDKNIYGEKDERYAIGLARLAKVYEAQKRYREAETCYRQALAASEASHEPGDPHLKQRLRTLAEFLRSRHKSSEAQTLERQARELDKE